MLSLLGVALSHGLLTESKIFLRLFLIALIRPSRNGIPSAITHPAYPSYLVQLCDEWTRLAPAACGSAFTRRTFAAITLEVLIEHGPRQVWTCKSVTRLAQLFRTQDFGCFLTFLRGLIEAITEWPRQHAFHKPFEDLVEDCTPFSRLAKWTGVIASDFFAIAEEDDANRLDASNTHAEHFNSITEILASAFDAGIHLQLPAEDSDDSTDKCSHQATLICVATLCLSTPLFSKISVQKQNALLALLRDTTPDSTTFGNIVHRPLAHLHTIAGRLRLHDLGALEVAMWTCAVEQLSCAEPRTDPASRTALLDALSVAERRFYMCAANAGKWEWEDMVGSWVRRLSPVRGPPRKRARETVPTRPKRRRLQSHPQHSSSSSSRSTSASAECTPSLSPAASSSGSSLLTPSSSLSSRSRSPVSVVVPGRTVSEDDSGSWYIRSARVERSALTTDKLRSVLADALRMRIDLREERRSHNSSRVLNFGCSRGEEGGEDRAWEGELEAATLPSEGDVLDMFAYDDDDDGEPL